MTVHIVLSRDPSAQACGRDIIIVLSCLLCDIWLEPLQHGQTRVLDTVDSSRYCILSRATIGIKGVHSFFTCVLFHADMPWPSRLDSVGAAMFVTWHVRAACMNRPER